MNSILFDEINKNDFIIAVKLHINQRLFEKGHITEEMYIKAKEIILRH